MNSLQVLRMLWHYMRAKRLQHKYSYGTREVLEQYQQQALKRFAKTVLAKNPYFRDYAHLPMAQWPLMDKAVMMANFDQMNTAGLMREKLFACANQAQQSRDFSTLLRGFSVGLSVLIYRKAVINSKRV